MNLPLLLVLCGVVILLTVMLGRKVDGWLWRRTLVAYRLTLPANLTLDQAAAWLGVVAAYAPSPRLALLPAPPIALELLASRDGIAHILLLPARARGAVLSGLRATLPAMRLTEAMDYLNTRPGVRRSSVQTPREPAGRLPPGRRPAQAGHDQGHLQQALPA